MKSILTAAAMAFLCAGCLPDAKSPIEPLDYAPPQVRPYLGVQYDMSVSYDSVKTVSGAKCTLDAMPFAANPRFSLDWQDNGLRLQTVNPRTRVATSVQGSFALDAGSGAFRFTSWIPDANAEHYYDINGAYQRPGDLREMSFRGTYRRVEKGMECDVYFTARGARN